MKTKESFLITFVVVLFVFLAVPLFAQFGGNTTGKCPSVDPGYTVLLPNPDDCNSFFMCSGGIPILQKCPEGLHFNDALKMCDWPQYAGCEPISNDHITCRLTVSVSQGGTRTHVTYCGSCIAVLATGWTGQELCKPN